MISIQPPPATKGESPSRAIPCVSRHHKLPADGGERHNSLLMMHGLNKIHVTPLIEENRAGLVDKLGK